MLDVQQEFDIASITAGLLRYHIAMIYYLTRTRQDGSESIARRYNGSYSPIEYMIQATRTKFSQRIK